MRQAVTSDAIAAADVESERPDGEILDWPRVYQSIATLRSREQAIVTLRFFEQMSHAEIAATLNLRPGAVRVALSRAIAKLRKLLLPQKLPPAQSL